MRSTINKYIETLTFTRSQAFTSRIVTFKMLSSSPRFGVDRHFLYGFSFLPRAWPLRRMRISSHSLVLIADVRDLFIDETLELVTEETCWSRLACYVPPGGCQMFSDNVRSSASCLLRFHKILAEKYLLWKARTSWNKRFRSFLIRLFSFLTVPWCWHVPYIFMKPLLIS